MRIDLNADVAESADDLAMLDVVTSANVCCGAYAGSEELMLDACEAALERGVVIGAQVGYPDREGFGRRPMDPASDERQAAAVVEAVGPYGLPMLGLPGAASLRIAAEEGLETVREGFADRAYRDDGTLVPRTEDGAVLSDTDDVVAQALKLVGTVDSICLHGDSPGALDLATAVHSSLEDAGHDVRSFA